MMTVEERLQKIEETVLVVVEMQSRTERRWERQFSELTEVVVALGHSQKQLHTALSSLVEQVQINSEQIQQNSEQIQRNADNIANLQSALNSLIATVDRFIQGRNGNGQQK